MRNINSFAVAVQRWRRERALTLGQVAERTSYSTSYLSKMVHGHRPLLPAAVSEIDQVLGAGGELIRLASEQRASGRPAVRPMQLPSAVPGFVGRERYLRRIDAAVGSQANLGAAAVVVIEGGFWVGKTALAVHWAAHAVHAYAGGCLFADMRGLAPGRPAATVEVLDGFLRALGADQAELHASVSDKAAHYRSLLAQRPAIILLDNVAGYDQVKDLLPGTGSVVLATSREYQAALPLKTGGARFLLPPLRRDESLTLLRQRIGDARVDSDSLAANAVAENCGDLPMAILIAAEQLQQRRQPTLHRLAEVLADGQRVLDVFSSPEREVNIRNAIDLSYLALPSQAARVFRLLGICPAGTIVPACVAALADINESAAEEALATLRQAHLLDDAPMDRVRMNSLARTYAYQRGLVDEPLSEVERAHDRVLRWYARSAAAASNGLAPGWSGHPLARESTTDVPPATSTDDDYDRALAWCQSEVDTVVELVRNARSVAAGDALWQLASAFLPYFLITKNRTAWLALATAGVNAARAAGSPIGLARCQQSLGWALHELGRNNEALEHLSLADYLLGNHDDKAVRAWTALGRAATLADLGCHNDARDAYDLADRLFSAIGCEFGAILTGALAATTQQKLGDIANAAIGAEDALIRAQKHSPKSLLGFAHYHFGLVLQHQHDLRSALAQFDAALARGRAGDERWAEAEAHLARAEALAQLGDDDATREAYVHAEEIFEKLRDPRVTEIRTRLAMLGAGRRQQAS